MKITILDKRLQQLDSDLDQYITELISLHEFSAKEVRLSSACRMGRSGRQQCSLCNGARNRACLSATLIRTAWLMCRARVALHALEAMPVWWDW